MRVGLFLLSASVLTFVAEGAAPPKPLAIQNIALSQYEDGPTVPIPPTFVPGDAIFFSFQISGYKIPEEEDGRIDLGYHIELKDPAGVPVLEPQSDKVYTMLSQEDKNWAPKARWTIAIPPYAPPGVYHIQIRVEDHLAKTEVKKEVEFTVRGHAVEASDTLVIRDFHFYRGEQDKDPLPVAAYRPGDAVWIRFEITGYKFAAKNRFEAGYGLTVLRPNGEATFSQPEAAMEKDENFYPRGFLPAIFSLNLPKDIQPGQYTVIVKGMDRVGNQTCELRQTFAVEQ